MEDQVFEKLSDEDKTTYLKYCMRDNLSNLTLNSVILSQDNKDKITDFVSETEHKDQFVSYGLDPINRILCYGASGTGKTFMTKCLAAEFKMELLAIDIAGALSSGNAPRALEAVFNLADKLGHCIIFLDECDAIAQNREESELEQEADVRRAINVLFQLLDRMDYNNIFVAATNLYTELDPAFVRRFNIRMRFDKPPIKNFNAIVDKFRNDKFKYEKDMDSSIKSIVDKHLLQYDQISYYEIETWVQRAEKDAIIDGTYTMHENVMYKYLMESLRIAVRKNDNTGELYLITV